MCTFIKDLIQKSLPEPVNHLAFECQYLAVTFPWQPRWHPLALFNELAHVLGTSEVRWPKTVQDLKRHLANTHQSCILNKSRWIRSRRKLNLGALWLVDRSPSLLEHFLIWVKNNMERERDLWQISPNAECRNICVCGGGGWILSKSNVDRRELVNTSIQCH